MGILSDIQNQITKTDFVNVVQGLIDDEVEAIVGYEKAEESLKTMVMKDEGYRKSLETFEHIIAEEREHIRELEELIK